MEDAEVSGQGGVEERKNWAESSKEGMELRSEVGRRKRREMDEKMLRRGEKKRRKRRESEEMGGGEKRFLQKIKAEWGKSEELREGMKESKYWAKEDERRCRVCGYEEETWEHVWERCREREREGGWQENVREILGEDGDGEWWMRAVEKSRGKEEIEE
ncbi:hypothetical protein PV325_010311 [Microctonus aethiopoides]|nr:hypothetical protein PV325_010311 [Microctonus aethiopoides]